MKANKYMVLANGDATIALFSTNMSVEEVQESQALLAYGDGATATFIETTDINVNDYMESNGEYVSLGNFDDFDDFDDYDAAGGFY